MLSRPDPIPEAPLDAKRLCETAFGGSVQAVEMLVHQTQRGIPRYVARVTLASGKDVVVKRNLSLTSPAEFRNAKSAYCAAYERLKQPPFATPELLWSDDDAQVLIFAHYPGLDLNSHLTLAGGQPAQMAPFLTLAGQWMAAFHDLGSAPQVTYQPRFMVEHLADQIGQIRSGHRTVWNQDAFQAAAGQLATMAPDARATTRRAPVHGDLHAGNILIHAQKGRACGIDFVTLREAPIGHDVARLLVNVAVRFGTPAKVRKGDVVQSTILDAFFKGYGPHYREDPSIQFLLRYALIAEWVNLPATAKARTWQQEFHLEQVRKLSRKAFDV